MFHLRYAGLKNHVIRASESAMLQAVMPYKADFTCNMDGKTRSAA